MALQSREKRAAGAASAPPGQPSNADQLVAAGLEQHRAGNIQAADGLYAQALRARPDHADALNLGGAAAFALGRTQDAIRLIGRAIKAAPNHKDAYLNLAEALERAERTPEAIKACHDALALAPDFSDAYARLAWLNANAGFYDMAIAFSRVALGLDPGSVQALCARGAALWRLQKIGEAEDAYRAALDIAPQDLPSLTGLGVVLCETDRTAEAEELYRRALAVKPDDSGILGGLGRVAEVSGDIDGALAFYDRANQSSAGSVVILYNRGRCLRDAGRFDEAEAAFNEVLSVEPQHAPSLYALMRMKRLENGPNTQKRLARLISDSARPAMHRIQAGFAAGELLDNAGDSDAAFRRFSEANALYARTREARGERFDGLELRNMVDLIVNRLAREYARDATGWGNPSETPVFVVGMPRSGTTLVEQICASHSEVFGAGELKWIQTVAAKIAKRNEGRARVAEWDGTFARSIADGVLKDLERLGNGARRVVDKSPLNIMRLGLIGALFPNARVIWCRRDLRDVVVSNHTMYFGQGNVYSTSQADCAYFATQVERLGECWLRDSKLKILELRYESLVSDLEGHVRQIIDFLGVPWEPGCLEFYKTDRHVQTPSSWQVRQPVYTRSVGRWRRFEKHLGPMLAALAANTPGLNADLMV